uniref:Integrase catalytic domain-containing protein n=1 Tax=Tanacetum cinerariifolium TaxID=118510 RepID=A0A6L2LHA9_TANCI|nr:hypothetical protein [Tanacetum cinerariifolium]
MAAKNLMQMSTDIVKLDRFDGGVLSIGKKMQFLLATLKVAYVLTKPYPEESKNETLAVSRERLKFENDDFICRGHILNDMSNPLFNVYENYSMAKDDLSLKDLGKHLLIEEQYRLENKTNDDTSKVHAMEEKGESSKAGRKKRRHDDKEKKKSKKNKKDTMFKTYEPSDSMLYMGNHSTAQVKGKGKIDLVFTSGNTLTLKIVLHIRDVRKNLVSRSLLNKFGFKLVFESNKFILSKGGKFVGKGYHTGEMFKLNIKDVVNSSVNDVNMTEISDTNDASAGIVTNNNAINSMPTSSYYFDPSLLWHARLGHIYFTCIRNIANANLNPKLDSKNDKCQTCMHTKITRLPFPTIQRSSKILELVYSDVCDLHATPTIGEKKYFATFIDDYSRYCYVYLLYSKNEVLEKFKIYKNEVKLKCDTRIKCLRTDRDGEYYDPRYFQSTGIVHQVTAPYTPQQNDLEQVQITKKLLSKNFDIKDLGEADVILGIKILRKENRLMLTQSHYIKKILKRFDSFNCFPISTPFEVGSKLTYNTSRILAENKYAKKTIDYGLEYSGDPSVLEGYTDASWITNQEDYASTSRWIFTLGGGVVSWRLKKHSCLTDSTMAVEFVALASCCKEAERLWDLLINIPL